MRARYLDAWPALSNLYGIHPWDVERLTFAELNAYAEDLNERVHQQRQQQSRSSRGIGRRR